MALPATGVEPSLGAILTDQQRREVVRQLRADGGGVMDLEIAARDAPRHQTVYGYPSAPVAVIAGIVGVVALPVISVAACFGSSLCILGLGVAIGFAHLQGNQGLATSSKTYLYFLLRAFPLLAVSLIPGASLLFSAVYLLNTERNPDNNYRRPIGG